MKNWILKILWKTIQSVGGFKKGEVIEVYSKKQSKYIKGVIQNDVSGCLENGVFVFYFSVLVGQIDDKLERENYQVYCSRNFKYDECDEIWHEKIN